jgi:predicted RNase H-like HicB family nuclease
MLKVYPAIFHKENGSFWVEFPDLDGCQSEGDTLEEAISMAQEALGLYLVALEEDNIKPKEPSDISSLQSEANSFSTYVSCDINKYRRNNKAVKKTLTIPDWLNKEAEKRHVNFSSVLQNALMQQIDTDNQQHRI